MPIHYQQYTDTFSILNYQQNHCLWRKNGQKLVLYYLENSKLPTKPSFVEKKTVKIGTILSRKSSKKDPSRLVTCAMFTSETNYPPGCWHVLMPFNIRVSSCRYELAVIFTCRLCIDNRDFAFFVFERTKHQPRRNLRSYLVLHRLCNEAALSPGIDAFWY